MSEKQPEKQPEKLPEKEAIMNESSYRAFEQIDPELKRSSIKEPLLPHEEVRKLSVFKGG